MGVRLVTLSSGVVIRIRPYRPDDRDQVIRIFTAGMMGLAPDGVGHILRKNRRLQVLTCAAPVAALLAPGGLLIKAAASLGAAAAVPCFVYGLLRRVMRGYVDKCVNGPDLSSIEAFYSTAGAGHGSAFWVAELVEKEQSPSTAATAADVTPSPARATRFSLTAKSSSLSVTAPDEPSVITPPDREAAEDPPATPAAAAPDAAPALAGTAAAVEAAGAPASAGTARSEHGAAAPLAPGGTDEAPIRELVKGLVAAAIARFEVAPGAASKSTPRPAPAPAPVPTSSPATDALAAAITNVDLSVRERQEKGGGSGPSGRGSDDDEALATLSSVATPSAATTPVADGQQQPRVGSYIELVPQPTAASRAPARRRPATIIGHVALERKSWKLAELRRMSVLRHYGGKGVGRQLLETLVAHARDVGFQELVLQTSGMQPAARRLYERGGWVVSDVTEDHGIAVYTYTLDLTKKRR